MSDQETLTQKIGSEPTRSQVVKECVVLVDEEVQAKSGVSGLAIKGAYGTVKKIKPDFVTAAIDGLLDGWLARLEPYYASWRQATGSTFAQYVTVRADDVAEDLLAVTDARAETSKYKAAAKLYTKLRPSAKKHVATAVPKLGALVERHLG